MNVSELLDQIRGHYVARLLEAIAEQRAAEGVTVVHEAALRDEQGKIAGSGDLDTPMRVDLALVQEGEVIDSINVDTAGMLAFEPFTFAWPENDLNVTIEPFQWNWLQVQTTAAPTPDDWRVIRNWFMKWFKEVDPKPNRLAGAVHFMENPKIDGDSIELTLDLGTAPLESFEELLDALGSIGARDLRVGQFTPDES